MQKSCTQEASGESYWCIRTWNQSEDVLKLKMQLVSIFYKAFPLKCKAFTANRSFRSDDASKCKCRQHYQRMIRIQDDFNITEILIKENRWHPLLCSLFWLHTHICLVHELVDLYVCGCVHGCVRVHHLLLRILWPWLYLQTLLLSNHSASIPLSK